MLQRQIVLEAQNLPNRRESNSQFLFFGLEFFLGEFARPSRHADSLDVGFDIAHSFADLDKDALLGALKDGFGLFNLQASAGESTFRGLIPKRIPEGEADLILHPIA